MEIIEQVAYVIVLGIAFFLIAYGLLKLRGTELLKRGRYPDPPGINHRHFRDDRVTWFFVREGDHWKKVGEVKYPELPNHIKELYQERKAQEGHPKVFKTLAPAYIEYIDELKGEIEELENADDTPDFISQNHLSEQTLEE